MSEHEFDPELIREIEEFLRSQRKATLADIRPEWRDLVPRMLVQGEGLEYFLRQQRGVSMNVVSAEQAVVDAEELVTLARGAAQLVILSEFSDEDHRDIYVRRYPTSDFEAFTVDLERMAIPSVFPTSFIIFENWLSGNIDEVDPQLAQALGINDERPIGRLTIGRQLGAISDPQTRSMMEYIIEEFPEAPQSGHFYTDYYFFGDRMGKVVSLPSHLLGERVIGDEFSWNALSEVTPGDLVIAKVGLHTIEQGLIPHIPTL